MNRGSTSESYRKTVPQHWHIPVTPASTTHAAGLIISTAIPAHCFRSPGYHKYWQNPEYTSSYYRVFPSSPQQTTDVNSDPRDTTAQRRHVRTVLFPVDRQTVLPVQPTDCQTGHLIRTAHIYSL